MYLLLFALKGNIQLYPTNLIGFFFNLQISSCQFYKQRNYPIRKLIKKRRQNRRLNTAFIAANKKPTCKSDGLLLLQSNFTKLLSDLSSPAITGLELAPSQFTLLVAKASSGHIPLPFLISNCKELAQR